MRRFVVLLTVVAGCSNGGGSPGPMDMAQSSLLDVCQMVATARQAAMLSCSGISMSFPLTVYATQQCLRNQRAADSGWLTLDPSKLPACLAALKTAPCATVYQNVGPEPAECQALYVAQSAAAGPCLDARECQSGTSCHNSACPGVCEVLSQAGEPCGIGCAPGLECNNQTVICVVSAKLGESCQDVVCATGLYCDQSVAGAATCQAKKAAGTICQPFNDECLAGLQCNNGVCGPPRKLGEACGATARCGTGGVCDETTSVCVLWRGENGVCHGEADCSPEFICTTPGGGTGTCVPWLEDGAACDPSVYRCRMPAVCSGGTCRVTNQCG